MRMSLVLLVSVVLTACGGSSSSLPSRTAATAAAAQPASNDTIAADGIVDVEPDPDAPAMASQQYASQVDQILFVLDANTDGVISRAEFRNYSDAQWQFALVDDFQSFDRDGDGRVVIAEAQRLFEREVYLARLLREPQWLDIDESDSTQIDTDGDGQISAPEIDALAQSELQRADADLSGDVSLQEFRIVWRQEHIVDTDRQFSMLDSSLDQQIDRHELAVWLAEVERD